MQRFIPTLLAAALAFSSVPAMAAADLVLFNGKVFTAEPGQGLVQAVAVQDGKILKAGSNAQINALADARTQRIDLAGKVLMPGMIDTHSHPVVAAFDSMRANLLDEVKPLPELEQWIIEQDQAGVARAGDVISIAGASSAYWDKSRELGQRFNQGRWVEQPVVLSGIDGHTGWANNAMLKRLKIDAALVKGLSEQDRSFVGHDADFTPNGYFAESRWDQVRSQIPAPSAEIMLKAAREAVKVNNQYGVTAWMDAAANAGSGDSLFDFQATEQSYGVLPLYRELAQKGELNAHVAALLLANPRSRPLCLEVLATAMKKVEGGPHLRFPGIKGCAGGVHTEGVIGGFVTTLVGDHLFPLVFVAGVVRVVLGRTCGCNRKGPAPLVQRFR